MAERIAVTEENDDAFMNVDTAIDMIVASLTTLDENLESVKTDTPQQKIALKKIRDLVDTALIPYTADVVKEMDEAFGE